MYMGATRATLAFTRVMVSFARVVGVIGLTTSALRCDGLGRRTVVVPSEESRPRHGNHLDKLTFVTFPPGSHHRRQTAVSRSPRRQTEIDLATKMLKHPCPAPRNPAWWYVRRASAAFQCACSRRSRVWLATPPSATSPSAGEVDGGEMDRTQSNPLDRDDLKRARVNNFITVLVDTPMAEWKPAILDEYMSSLLRGNLYRQAMAERLAKVRSGEDREALTRVDAFLTGYISQERRKASRKKVSVILTAATEGPGSLDDCVQILAEENMLESDLVEYIASLITAEENRCVQSELLEVLKMVRDRIQAELKTGSRPEIRTLARALRMSDARERREFLQKTFTKLEDLDEFVNFVEEGIEYMGNEFGLALRSNMPQENFDKMKAVYAEASAIRRRYLQ